MKSINQMVLLSVMIGLVAGLIYGPISVKPIFAEPPDPCFGDGCEGTSCEDSSAGFYVECCWTGPNGYPICQICWKADDGSFVSCDPPRTKGISDSSTIAPPPLGKAPPPSTEKCPDNSAVDSKGNCTPMTQLPQDSSNDNNDDKKPQFPRGNILGELQSNSELPTQS